MVKKVQDKWGDLIRVSDALGWLDAMTRATSGELNAEGVNMMREMAADARDALQRASDKGGLILRSEASAKIDAALAAPPEGIHPRNAGHWNTIKATFKEAMWYPLAVKEG